MQIEQPSPDKLIVSQSDRCFCRWIVAGLIVFASLGVIQFFRKPEGLHSEAVQGAAAACTMLAVVYLILFDKARFLFDRRSQRLFWSRQRAWKRREGELDFSAIKTVRTESPLGDEGIPSRRILIVKQDGGILPLTLCFSVDAEGRQLKLAKQLRVFIGQSPSADPIVFEVQAAVDAGRIFEAVRLLREREGLSLTAAKKRVDDLTRR